MLRPDSDICLERAAARFTGWERIATLILGLTPQALCCRPLRGLSVRATSLCATLLFVCLPAPAQNRGLDIVTIDRARVLKAANQYLSEKPITITASSSPRSAGGLHDFFSEGDYWWPDPQNPNGPYV